MSELSYLLVLPVGMLMYAILRSLVADGLCREADRCIRKKQFHEALALIESAKGIYGQCANLAWTSTLLILLIALAVAASILWPRWIGGAG